MLVRDFLMAGKPDYEALKQKVKKLERAAREQERAEKAYQKKTHELGERIKELNCLYGISSLREKPGLSIEETLQNIVDLIPPSWQYPASTCARIILGDEVYGTENFKETKWKQASDIIVHGRLRGRLEAFYIEEKPESDEGPFLKEERSLINAVAERLGRIIERKLADQSLRDALEESQRRKAEISALLEASGSVLEYREFEDAARAIFDSCRDLIGAPAGYVALLSEDGSENELVFLESGGLPCNVDPDLPMPIRGLRREAYHTGKAVYDNNFSKGQWIEFLPEGHVTLDNALFAPMVIRGKTLGLIGLANKPGGFSESDSRIASAFGELAAIALNNSRTMESLERCEEHIRSIVETASDAIISVDRVGRIAFWNDGAERMFGYSDNEIVGKSVTVIMPERFRKAHQNRIMEGSKREKTRLLLEKPLELYGLKKNGQEFPLELTLAGWKTKEGDFFTGIIRDISERKLAEEALKKAHHELENRVEERTEALRRISFKLLGAQEEERRRIALELHDSIGQSLSAIKYRVETSVQEIGEEKASKSAEFLKPIIPIVQKSIEEVRRIQKNLRPSTLDDLGLLATVSWFCREFETIYSGIRVEKQIHLEDKDVPGPLKIIIFRVLQESFNNIAKHSRADLVNLSLRRSKGKIELSITDNGVGFDEGHVLSEKPSEGGLGLASMKERAELSGGAFSIQPKKGSGTTVRASWPISKFP